MNIDPKIHPIPKPHEEASPRGGIDEGGQTIRQTHHHYPSDHPSDHPSVQSLASETSAPAEPVVIYGLPPSMATGRHAAEPEEAAGCEVPELPGIDQKIVAAAKIRKCDFVEAVKTVGIPSAGILIPYPKLDGSPVCDPERPYFRLRLDEEQNGKKYHQPPKTGVHTFITPNFAALCRDAGEILVVEGEKKALALASEGWAALGMSGFYGCMNGPGVWTEEFSECLRASNPDAIYFIGDRDTIFNAQFSDAALKVGELLKATGWTGVKLRAVIVPPEAPEKGVDDCRGILGEKFRGWFERILADAIEITTDTSKGDLAIALLRLHQAGVERMCNEGKTTQVGEGLAKLSAGIGNPLIGDNIKEFASEFGIKPRTFDQMVKAARTKQISSTVSVGVAADTIIDLSEPVGEWTRKALERIAQATYVTSDGKLARLCGPHLEPFCSKSLPAYIDRPDIATFTKTRVDDTKVAAKFAQPEAELVLGSVRQNQKVLRPVRLISSIPVLVEKPEGGVDLVQSYDRQLEILVTGPASQIPLLPLHDAFNGLYGLFKDFCFPSWPNYAALLALVLTPALVRGGFLGEGRVPFFLVQKDQKGAGGGLLCRAICALYNQPPEAITLRDPNRAYEAISSSLFKGTSILILDNLRGNVLSDLPFLESLLTEPLFAGRMLYRDGAIDVRKLVIMGSSNGVKLSEDLADRAIEIQIRKRPYDYQFNSWPEGDLISHIEAKRVYYLACIYSIVEWWVREGKPGGNTTGLRFDRWERAVAGSLERYPGTPLALFPDGARGRRRATSRLSSPDFESVEEICRTICARRREGEWLTAHEIVRITEHETFWDADNLAVAARALGMILKKFCGSGAACHDVGDDYVIQHRTETFAENNYKQTNQYQFYRAERYRDPGRPRM